MQKAYITLHEYEPSLKMHTPTHMGRVRHLLVLDTYWYNKVLSWL